MWQDITRELIKLDYKWQFVEKENGGVSNRQIDSQIDSLYNNRPYLSVLKHCGTETASFYNKNNSKRLIRMAYSECLGELKKVDITFN